MVCSKIRTVRIVLATLLVLVGQIGVVFSPPKQLRSSLAAAPWDSSVAQGVEKNKSPQTLFAPAASVLRVAPGSPIRFSAAAAPSLNPRIGSVSAVPGSAAGGAGSLGVADDASSGFVRGRGAGVPLTQPFNSSHGYCSEPFVCTADRHRASSCVGAPTGELDFSFGEAHCSSSYPPACGPLAVSLGDNKNFYSRRVGDAVVHNFDALVERVACAVAMQLRSASISNSSSSGSDSDGDIDWEVSTDFVSLTGKLFNNIKIFESICKRDSSSFILLKDSRYCLLIGSDSKGPDAPGAPPPCLQVLHIINPEIAKKHDCEYWADYAQRVNSDAWTHSNMLATSLEFLAKKLRILSPTSSRSERENGGFHTATIGSPHRHFWSTHLFSGGKDISSVAVSAASSIGRRVELDEACLLLNSKHWNDLFCIFVKKMWINGRGGNASSSRAPETCWRHLMEKNARFSGLVEQWNERHDAYFVKMEVGSTSPLSDLVGLFPQRDGWTGEKPFWLKTDRWLE